ncbi:hypothetical protein RF11_14757 [Thelohanellus kitauei]|uniref:Uncharacterized protein n=1 Tax=Thelohanellus kitauei TaxID=669202 RepID=A0A0C2MPG0_THEKT|nr:hypothetical protein RF11_14757 [Thelohanellus kitauei]
MIPLILLLLGSLSIGSGERHTPVQIVFDRIAYPATVEFKIFVSIFVNKYFIFDSSQNHTFTHAHFDKKISIGKNRIRLTFNKKNKSLAIGMAFGQNQKHYTISGIRFILSLRNNKAKKGVDKITSDIIGEYHRTLVQSKTVGKYQYNMLRAPISLKSKKKGETAFVFLPYISVDVRSKLKSR